METKGPDRWRDWFRFALLLAGFWVIIPMFDLLRVGFGSRQASSLAFEAIGRAFIVVVVGGLVASVLEKTMGRKKSLPQKSEDVSPTSHHD